MSQNVTVFGNVKSTSGEPVPDVTLMVKRTTNGTVTDSYGNYSLSNVPSGFTLVFSFLGIISQEIKVTGKTNINLTMKEKNYWVG
jgi:hypothetical protein